MFIHTLLIIFIPPKPEESILQAFYNRDYTGHNYAGYRWSK